MAEDTTPAPGETAAHRASEQARLRKERREAKIKAGGSARLNKITGIGGRIVGETEQATPPTAAAADPDEVDLSQYSDTTSFSPASPPRGGDGATGFSEAQLRQLMLGLDRDATASPGAGPSDDDPLMKMMSQMMSGFGGGSSSPFAGMPFPQPPPQQQVPRSDGYTLFFRLLHALLGLGLGLYLTSVLLAPPLFTGTRAQREQQSFAASTADEERRKLVFFWVFATGEAVLLSSRFFLDKARQPPPGLLWTAVGFLPEPLKGYVSIVLRYGQFFMTVRADVLACVFVLGAACWYRT